MRTKATRLAFLIALSLSCADSAPYFIPGSATLPTCEEPPAFDVSGTWGDRGTVTVDTAGCDGAEPGAMFASCLLVWAFTPSLDDEGAPILGRYTVLVDEEYIIEARVCGSTLYFEGGWWLPVAEPDGQCLYAEDSAEEVGIQEGGSALEVRVQPDPNPAAEPRLIAEGTLSVRGACEGSYAIELEQLSRMIPELEE